VTAHTINTPRLMPRSSAVIALLVVTLARCSSEAGPTAWIPHNGTISGSITATAVPASPPAALGTPARATAPGPALRLPALEPLAFRPAVRPRGTRLTRRAQAAVTPGDLIVTFRHTALGAPPVGSPAALAEAASAPRLGAAMRAHLASVVPAGAQVVGVSPTILAAKLHVTDTTRREAIAAALRQDPAIAAVTRNRLIWLDETDYTRVGTAAAAAAQRTVPDNLFYPFQAWHYGLIDLPRAWSITTGSAAVLVALVDDGTRFDHPALTANLTSDGYTFVNNLDSLTLCAGGKISNANNGHGYYPDPTIPGSYHLDSTGTCFIASILGGHGVHVAGTIGAVGNNGMGVTGVNWTVRIRPVRALGVGGFGSTYDIAQGVLYAAGLPADNGAGGTVRPASGATVINLSLGGPTSDTTLHSAIISAANAGALIVAAAGNAGTAAPQYPAAYPEVLAVAAVGPDAAPVPYSSFGPKVALRAPGGNFALGDASDGVGSAIWNFGLARPDYAFAEGTSMAAPHVTGVAALLLAHDASLTAATLRSRLMTYAVGPATVYGAGLVNAYNSLAQSHGPPTDLYARLYSATTGDTIQTVRAQGATFTFNQVAEGTYFVYAGTDESGDRHLGRPGRLWGALGGWTAPSPLTVLSAGPYPASFSIGLPDEVEPNHARATANFLAIGGYAQGTIVDSITLDMYRVRIPAAGTYTFETSGWVGACGFALEEATAIGLFDVSGTLLTSTGYIDPSHFNYCSRLTQTLTAQTYYVAVAGVFRGARYRLQARRGS
jgi:serine protease